MTESDSCGLGPWHPSVIAGAVSKTLGRPAAELADGVPKLRLGAQG